MEDESRILKNMEEALRGTDAESGLLITYQSIINSGRTPTLEEMVARFEKTIPKNVKDMIFKDIENALNRGK